MEEEQMLTKEQILDMLDAGQYKELKEELVGLNSGQKRLKLLKRLEIVEIGRAHV